MITYHNMQHVVCAGADELNTSLFRFQVAIFYNIGSNLFYHEPEKIALIVRKAEQCFNLIRKCDQPCNAVPFSGHFDVLFHTRPRLCVPLHWARVSPLKKERDLSLDAEPPFVKTAGRAAVWRIRSSSV
jgi:hypothetical protein